MRLFILSKTAGGLGGKGGHAGLGKMHGYVQLDWFPF